MDNFVIVSHASRASVGAQQGARARSRDRLARYLSGVCLTDVPCVLLFWHALKASRHGSQISFAVGTTTLNKRIGS